MTLHNGVQVTGIKNPNTGIKILYGKLSVRIRPPIQNSDSNVRVLYACNLYRIQVTQYGADTVRLHVKHKQINTHGTPLPESGRLHVEAQARKEKKTVTRLVAQDHKIARDLYIKIKNSL